MSMRIDWRNLLRENPRRRFEMENFVFQNETRIVFGKGTERQTGSETRKIGRRVLLHYGQGSIKRTGLYDRVVSSLKDSGIEFIELSGVVPNPRLSLVKEGIELCRKHEIEAILAVGGGSVIDSAKAIAAGVHYEGDVWDFYEGKATPSSALPVGVVLTIPAAGSESSVGSVITKEEGLLKRALNTPVIRPKFAILNPELTYTLPPYQTACGIADMMAHIMERYFTNTRNVELTDRLCEATLRTIINNSAKVFNDPEDYNARAELMWASTIAHNGLLNTGRVGDWASHQIEHELSGIYDIAHGAGLAIVFPAWMNYVMQHDVERFAQFASRVWGKEINPFDMEDTARQGIESLKNFFSSIGLPVRLSEAGIPDDRIDEMAEKATLDGPLGNFVKLGKKEIKDILLMAK